MRVGEEGGVAGLGFRIGGKEVEMSSSGTEAISFRDAVRFGSGGGSRSEGDFDHRYALGATPKNKL